MATSSNDPDALGRLPYYKYLYVSNTNVSNFVSVKLCGACNYQIWKTQMICLMEAHDMLGLVDEGSIDSSMKDMAKYESLLKGWIFGSLSEDVLRIVVDSKSSDKAKDVWNTLKRYFNATKSSDDQQDSTTTKTDTNTDLKDKNVVLKEIPTNDKCGNSTESEAKGEATTQTETEEPKISNLLSRKKTMAEIFAEEDINDKDISSADTEAKREDTTQPETKEEDINDKDISSADSEAKREDTTQPEKKGIIS
ncbi:hypothetical protein M8C21_033580 [Ambrosia artemisiifolia]|uniref:Uncharacterized protein n=1 Tax=Ambrosia artemisiifolia TaxID=4212 RepID=A0AAD5DAP9_AMBAR|nr:hypothetical protein M8C21_033580 [Ambrosia artemisiifolia]